MVEDSAGKELSNVFNVSLTIVNENGGYSSLSSSYTTGTGYSVQTPTVGSRCLVVATITYTDSTPSQTFYKTDVDLSTSAPTLDLAVPAAPEFTTVAVSDAIVTTSTATSGIKCDLVVPGYGAVPVGQVTPIASSSFSLSIYDPDGYQAVWVQFQRISVSSTVFSQ